MNRRLLSSALAIAACVALYGVAFAQSGKASKAPKVPGRPSRISFETLDRNFDKKISAEEFRNGMAYVFRSQDRDLDGVVTRKEVELAGPRAVAAFEEAGGRASGTLELPAFLDFSMQIFNGVDTDGNGFVTADESSAAVAKVKAARQK